MAIEKKIIRLIIITLIFLPATAKILSAQTVGYIIERRFLQQITWTDVRSASRYEVIIEKEENGIYQEQMRRFSNDNTITLSLLTGKYRYMVIPYNNSNEPGEAAQWVNFEIFNIRNREPLAVRRVNLSWTGDEYAGRYEVVIEKEESGRFMEILRESANTPFMEVSLLPGKYHYSVIPYDYLNQPGIISRRIPFEVRNGVLPNEINDDIALTDPEPDNRQSGNGNIIAGLPNENNDDITLTDPVPDSRQSGNGNIITVPDNRQLSNENIIAGDGDSDEERLARRPRLKRNTDIYFGASWTPLLLIYEYDNHFSGETPNLLCMEGKLGMIFGKNDFINTGVEFAISWYTEMELLAFDLNILAQRFFPNGKTALNLRFGAGLFLSGSFATSDNRPIRTNTGLSLFLPLGKHFYMETGINYAHWFKNENAGFFHPWIGIGTHF